MRRVLSTPISAKWSFDESTKRRVILAGAPTDARGLFPSSKREGEGVRARDKGYNAAWKSATLRIHDGNCGRRWPGKKPARDRPQSGLSSRYRFWRRRCQLELHWLHLFFTAKLTSPPSPFFVTNSRDVHGWTNQLRTLIFAPFLLSATAPRNFWNFCFILELKYCYCCTKSARPDSLNRILFLFFFFWFFWRMFFQFWNFCFPSWTRNIVVA